MMIPNQPFVAAIDAEPRVRSAKPAKRGILRSLYENVDKSHGMHEELRKHGEFR